MPFSSGRSVRAPASKATRIVVGARALERDAVERQAVGGGGGADLRHRE